MVDIARYREKDETDLLWNKIRRRLTRELDTQIADWREAALNQILSGAWEKYVAALSTGTKLELETHYVSFVETALTDAGINVVVRDDDAAAA